MLNIDCIVGIDPGASGGIAIYRDGHRVQTVKMPREIDDVRQLLEYYTSISRPLVFLEKLSIRPDDIAVDGGGANLGKLFRVQRMMANFEQLKAVISVCGVPFVLVHPMKWQSYLKLRVKGIKEEKPERKRRYKDTAGKLYPLVRPTMWNADALLIMHFGRRILQDEKGLKWVRENLPTAVHGTLFS